MRGSFEETLRKAAIEREGKGPSLSLEAVRRLASELGIIPLEVEIAALENGIVPERYDRNIGTIGIEGQVRLLRSCIGVCGLGGLGGAASLSLARFGVGRLILADGDVFVESNLNRQILCLESDLGRSKAEVAAERVAAVNGSTLVTTCARFLGPDDIPQVFSGADVVIDALDTVTSRLALEEGCAKLGVPMVHGAIAGDSGQVMTVYPGDPGLKALYSGGGDRGVEDMVGNPPTTPSIVASLQVQEAVKTICGGEVLRNGFLILDISANVYQFIPLK